AEQGDGRHEQAGRNRPPDESFRDIHLLLLAGPHPRSFSLGFAARPSSASLGPQALPPDLHDPPDSFLPAAPPAASTTAWPRRTFCLLLHAAAGLETKLAFRDDRLPRLEPLVDHDIVVDAAADGDRPLFDGEIRL